MLSLEQKRQLLLERGFDPAGYDIDDSDGVNGIVYKKEQQQPTVTQPTETNTFGKAFLTSARRNIGGVLGGAGAIGASTPLNTPLIAGGLALAPETFGLSLAPAAIALLAEGALGAYAGGKAQGFVEPKLRGESELQTQQRLEQEAELARQQKFGTFLGEIAPQAFLARPSPSTLISGAKGLGKALVGSVTRNGLRINPVEAQALMEIAPQAALGAGGELAGQVQSGEYNIPRIAGAGLAGGLLSKPYGPISKALGFKSSEKAVAPEEGGLAGELSQGELLKQQREAELQAKARTQLYAKPNYQDIINETLVPRGLKSKVVDVATGTGIEKRVVDLPPKPEKSAKETADVFKKTEVLKREQILGQLEELRTKREEAGAKEAEINAAREKALKSVQFEERIKELDNKIEQLRTENELAKAAQQSQKTVNEAGEPVKPIRRVDTSIKQLNYDAYVKAKKANDTIAVKAYETPEFKSKYESGDTTPYVSGAKNQARNIHFQEENAGLEQQRQDLITAAKTKGVPGLTTNAVKIAEAVGAKRGIGFKLTPNLSIIKRTPEGGFTTEEIRGRINTLRKNINDPLVAELNPNKASIDTPWHEALHGYFEDLETYGGAKDKALMSRFYEGVKTLPEYKTASEKNPDLTPHEFAVEHGAYEIANRLYNLDNTGNTWKSWWKDVVSSIKTRFGKADTKDYIRLFSNRYFNDPAFTGSFKPLPTTTIGKEKITNENINQTSRIEPSKTSEGGPAEANRVGGTEQTTGQHQTTSQGIEENLRDRTSGDTVKQPDRTITERNPSEATKEDYDRFTTLGNRFKELVDSGDINQSPEFKTIFQEMENIKNKYGGMPPLKSSETDVKLQNLNQGITAGPNQEYWIDPDGRLLPIKSNMSGGHAEFAKEFLKSFKDVPETSRIEAPYSVMFSKGFSRVARAGDTLMVENSRGISNKQKKALVDFAVEKNLSVVLDRGSRSQTIYSPDDKLQTEQQGLETKEASPLETARKSFLDKVTADLKDRKIFRDIEVQEQPSYDYNGKKIIANGFIDPNTGRLFAVPNNPNTALHESLHKLQWSDRDSLLKAAGINDFNSGNNDVLDIAHTFKDYHQYYDWFSKYYPPKDPVQNKDLTFRILDEALATIATPNQPKPVELAKLEHSLKNLFGKDFVDTYKSFEKNPETAPKYSKFKTSQTMQEWEETMKKFNDLRQEFDDKYSKAQIPFDESVKTELDQIAAQTKELNNKLKEIKAKDPGFYYQNVVQGLDIPTIRNNFELVRRGEDFQKESVLKTAWKDLAAGRLPVFGSEIDKFEARSGAPGKMLAPALRETFEKERQNLGRYWGPTLAKLDKLNDTNLDNLLFVLRKESNAGELHPEELNSGLRPIYDEIREKLKLKQTDQAEANEPVAEFKKGGKIIFRLPKVNPTYFPAVVGRKQLDFLLNSPESIQSKLLKDDFIGHQKEKYDLNDDQAQQMLEDVLASYGGPLSKESTHFNAVRKAEGIGLPDTWVETDLKRLLDRYWRRVSKDRAFFDTVEKDPNLATIVGQKKDAWGNPIHPTDPAAYSLAGNDTLQNIMAIVQGRQTKTNPRIDALSRIASNTFLGPMTGLNDFISGPFLLSKYIPSVGHIPGYVAALKDIVTGVEHAKQTGNIRQKISDYQDIFGASTEFADKLNNVANLITKYTGRDLLEKVSRGGTQAIGEYLAKAHYKLAQAGNKKSIAFMEKLANTNDWKTMGFEELGTRISQLGQGTYDPRGLPAWALDSPIAPVFRLSKWGIEQSNNYLKHVILPARNGNFAPLIYSLLGAGIGGYLIKELREKVSGRKLSVPGLDEISASSGGYGKNIPNVVYNAMAAASYSGMFGFGGDIMKSLFDISHKNLPQGFNYPLIEITGNGAVRIGQAAQAIADGENILEVAPKLLAALAKDNTQVGRLALNNFQRFSGDEKFKDAEDRRNLRVFKMVEDLPYDAQEVGTANPFINTKVKAFKEAETPEDIMKAYPDVIQDILKKAKGDPEELQRRLRGLKNISEKTFPSPETNPRMFSRYQKYLGETLGESKAGLRSKSYFMNRELNKAKSSLVPGL